MGVSFWSFADPLRPAVLPLSLWLALAITSAASGPWIASSARSSSTVSFASPDRWAFRCAKSASLLPALTTTYRPSWSGLPAIRSSRIPPRSFSSSEYFCLPAFSA